MAQRHESSYARVGIRRLFPFCRDYRGGDDDEPSLHQGVKKLPPYPRYPGSHGFCVMDECEYGLCHSSRRNIHPMEEGDENHAHDFCNPHDHKDKTTHTASCAGSGHFSWILRYQRWHFHDKKRGDRFSLGARRDLHPGKQRACPRAHHDHSSDALFADDLPEHMGTPQPDGRDDTLCGCRLRKPFARGVTRNCRHGRIPVAQEPPEILSWIFDDIGYSGSGYVHA